MLISYSFSMVIAGLNIVCISILEPEADPRLNCIEDRNAAIFLRSDYNKMD